MTPAPSGAPAWDHAVADIPPAGLGVERSADRGECESIGRALDLIACTRFSASYTIIPSGSGRYRLKGTMRCELAQVCGVSLEPVTSAIEERLDVPFWPEADIPAPKSGEVDLEGEEDPEPITEGRIAVGRLLFECLAAAIDPFPRKPEAMLERSAAGTEDETGAASPFAVLAGLGKKG
jgi:hypothetical protein